MVLRNQTQQMIGLAALPLTRSFSVRCNHLRWEGELQPTPLSVQYRIRIDARSNRRPRVRVVSPELTEPASELPHVFRDGSLCLCMPWQWDRTKSISRVMLPWISEWLLYYELWKATGEWLGGGHGEPAHGQETEIPV